MSSWVQSLECPGKGLCSSLSWGESKRVLFCGDAEPPSAEHTIGVSTLGEWCRPGPRHSGSGHFLTVRPWAGCFALLTVGFPIVVMLTLRAVKTRRNNVGQPNFTQYLVDEKPLTNSSNDHHSSGCVSILPDDKVHEELSPWLCSWCYRARDSVLVCKDGEEDGFKQTGLPLKFSWNMDLVAHCILGFLCTSVFLPCTLVLVSTPMFMFFPESSLPLAPWWDTCFRRLSSWADGLHCTQVQSQSVCLCVCHLGGNEKRGNGLEKWSDLGANSQDFL